MAKSTSTAIFVVAWIVDVAFFVATPLNVRQEFGWGRFVPGGGIAVYASQFPQRSTGKEGSK